jgi:hypothetical protein
MNRNLKWLIIIIAVMFFTWVAPMPIALKYCHAQTDFNQYLDKNVKICTVETCYIGVVNVVLDVEICKRYEPLTQACIEKERYIAIFITDSTGKVHGFRGEAIASIEEIQ